MTPRPRYRTFVLLASWAGFAAACFRVFASLRGPDQSSLFGSYSQLFFAAWIVWTAHRWGSRHGQAAPENLSEDDLIQRLQKRLTVTRTSQGVTLVIPPGLLARLAGLLLSAVLPLFASVITLAALQVFRQGWNTRGIGALLGWIGAGVFCGVMVPWWWFLFSESVEIDATGLTYSFGPSRIWRKRRYEWKHVRNLRRHSYIPGVLLNYRISFEYPVPPHLGNGIWLGRHLRIREADDIIRLFERYLPDQQNSGSTSKGPSMTGEGAI